MIRKVRMRRTGGDAGFTLTEMLVGIVMLGLIMTALTSLMIVTQRVSGKNGSYLADTDQGRNAIEGVSKTLRTAVLPSQLLDYSLGDAAFIQGTDTSMQFYADLNLPQVYGPSKVSYSIVAASDGTGNLIETIQPPDQPVNAHNYSWCTPGPGCTSARTRTLAMGLKWPSPTVFTYYDTTGTAIATPLTAGGMANVRTVDIAFTVKTTSGFNQLPTTYLQRVSLPNVDVLPSASPTS